MKTMISILAVLVSTAAFAKLPAMNDEAKVKAAEAAAKAAHSGKVANFQLCKSVEKTAEHYYKTAKATGKETKPATDTPACIDPGAFVYVPAPPAPVAAATAGKPIEAAGAHSPASIAASPPSGKQPAATISAPGAPATAPAVPAKKS